MQAFINALTWTFVHSLWQGLLAALAVAIIISATRKTKAKLRYNLLWMVLVIFLAGSFITFLVQWNQQDEILLPASLLNERSIPINNTALSNGFVTDLTNWLNNNSELLLLSWTIFFVLKCIRLVTGMASVNRLRQYKTYPVVKEWKLKLDELCARSNIRKPVELLQSGLVKVPVVLGIFKPVILLPLGLITHLPPEQVETIILHELSHIRRKDYLLNLLQHLVEAIFFFNPAVIWISSLIREEREACCDDFVVEKSPEKLNYLNALVAFQEYSLGKQPYAMAISSRKHYLLGRIKRIITNENKRLNLFEKLALLSGLFVFSAFTYINQQEDIIELGSRMERIIDRPLPIITHTAKSEIQEDHEEKLMLEKIIIPLTDTIPPKKKKVIPVVKEKERKSPSIEERKVAGVPDEKKVLKEIEQMKEQIGKKKESIGLKKEQLKEQEGKDKVKVKEIEKEIEKEREEIETKRDELEKKREEYQNLKKKKETGKVDVKVSIDKSVAEKIKYAPTKDIQFDLAQKIKLNYSAVITKDIKFDVNADKFEKQEIQFKADHKIDYKPPRIEYKPRSAGKPPVKQAPRKTIQL